MTWLIDVSIGEGDVEVSGLDTAWVDGRECF